MGNIPGDFGIGTLTLIGAVAAGWQIFLHWEKIAKVFRGKWGLLSSEIEAKGNKAISVNVVYKNLSRYCRGKIIHFQFKQPVDPKEVQKAINQLEPIEFDKESKLVQEARKMFSLEGQVGTWQTGPQKVGPMLPAEKPYDTNSPWRLLEPAVMMVMHPQFYDLAVMYTNDNDLPVYQVGLNYPQTEKAAASSKAKRIKKELDRLARKGRASSKACFITEADMMNRIIEIARQKILNPAIAGKRTLMDNSGVPTPGEK